MNVAHSLKQDILIYLSKNTFEKSEFKYIYEGFTQNLPEFKSKKYYQKIYHLIREFEELNLLEIDKSGCTYKYSTNADQKTFLSLLEQSYDKNALQKQLLVDYHQKNSELHKIKAELEIFNKYLLLYPKIQEKIASFMNERDYKLLKLESELLAIDIILENIS